MMLNYVQLYLEIKANKNSYTLRVIRDENGEQRDGAKAWLHPLPIGLAVDDEVLFLDVVRRKLGTLLDDWVAGNRTWQKDRAWSWKVEFDRAFDHLFVLPYGTSLSNVA